MGIICLVGAGGARARPPQGAISPEAFWQQVDDTLAWLVTHPSITSAEWQVEATRWENIREVSISDQQVVPVDTSYIVHLMRENQPEHSKVLAYLSDLKQTRSLTTQAGGEQESQMLREILARPEFQDGVELNFIQKFLQWLSDWYSRLMNLLFGDAEVKAAIPSEITLTVTLLVIGAVLALVFRESFRNLFNEVELAEETPGEGEILSARLAHQKAQELSGSGDYRHALRYLYLSALLLLDERGLLRYNRAQTNREYLRQVRSRPGLAEHLKVVVETFDRVWYGYQAIDEADYAQYAEHVTALEETKE